MDGFDIARLTDLDFEAVCKDIFEEKLATDLELFAPGKDGGIDLRGFTNNGEAVVVQCKHWMRSSRQALIRYMERVEAPKVAKLSPARYLLATSADLTPDSKRKLRHVLAPYVLSEQDIYGLREIESELRSRPNVVRRHLRLWLSSSSVLQSLFSKAVLIRSHDLLEEVDESLRVYAPNDAFFRALDIMDRHHTCIIAGLPGIGKTTLAQVLSASYVSRGFEVVEISRDVEEGNKAWEDDRPQLFYYDDFLGQTALYDKFNKNEDSRLLQFMKRVRGSQSKRMVLTTREYILAQARGRYERLDRQNFDPFTCVLDLSDYNTRIRAQILYNHVYFSDISGSVRRKLAEPSSYWPIIRHRNFSPRLIHHTLNFLGPLEDISEPHKVIIDALENPSSLWQHIIEHQLEEAEVRLLELLYTFSSNVDYASFGKAWGAYFPAVDDRAAQAQLRHSMRILERTMLGISRSGRFTLIAYHNPSIRDFMHHYLSGRPEVIQTLLESAVFFEQVERLWIAVNQRRRSVDEVADIRMRAMGDRFKGLFEERFCVLFDSDGPELWRWSQVERVVSSLAVAEAINSHRIASMVSQVLQSDVVGFLDQMKDGSDVVEFVKAVQGSSLPALEQVKEDVLDAGIDLVTANMYSYATAKQALDLIEELSDYVDVDDIQGVREEVDWRVREAFELFLQSPTSYVPHIKDMVEYASSSPNSDLNFPMYEDVVNGLADYPQQRVEIPGQQELPILWIDNPRASASEEAVEVGRMFDLLRDET
ncbi:restriction endonuclease [Micromonospora chalcea]|uniref:nSTAND3 domain-containing NTPase n=1 Tax=Micromonospora chalcea TaxID=1874 RepID=UPI003317A8CA